MSSTSYSSPRGCVVIFIGTLAAAILTTTASWADIFVTDQLNSKILRYNETTGAFIGVFADASSGLNQPIGLAIGRDGNLYVSNRQSNKILRFNSTGTLVGQFAPAGDDFEISPPYDMAFGPNGNLFVSSVDHIYELDGVTGKRVGDFFESGAKLVTPFDIRFGPNGNLFAIDRSLQTLKEFHGVTGAFIRDVVSPQPNVIPWSFVFDANSELFIASLSVFSVHRFDAGTGDLIGAFREEFSFNMPSTMEMSPDGNLFVYDFGSMRLRGFDVDTEEVIKDFYIPAASSFVFWSIPEPFSMSMSLSGACLLGMCIRQRSRRERHAVKSSSLTIVRY